MSNIFITIDKINALLNSKALTPTQIDFLQQLLHGNKEHIGLIELTQRTNPEHFKKIEQGLLNHYKTTSSRKFIYKCAIRSIHADIAIIQRHSENIIKAIGLDKSKAAFDRYAMRRDLIYKTTKTKYSGTIMLPILQCMDFRLGNSKGECSGYVLEWLHSFLNNKNPFGVRAHAAPPFQPIALNSKTGHSYPELNHCAPLTRKIADLQKLNHRFASKRMEDGSRGHINQNSEGGAVLTKDATQLIQNLLNSSKQNPNTGYYLVLRNYGAGHALGYFNSPSGQIHFLDVNTGWYRFNGEAEFIAWFKFYIHEMQYDKKYRICEFFSFGFQKKEQSIIKSAWTTFSLFSQAEILSSIKTCKEFMAEKPSHPA